VYDHSTSISNVGTKDRTITGISGDGAHNYQLPSSGLTSVTKIAPREIVLDWGDVSWTYDGTDRKKTISDVSWVSDMAPIPGAGPGLTISCPSVISVGTYEAIASITNTNYILGNPEQTLEIQKQAGRVASASAKSGLRYNGSYQTLINAPTGYSSGTVEYSWNGTSGWTTDITDMCGKNVDTYVVYYRAAESADCYASAVKSITVTISKGEVYFSTPPQYASGLVYDGNEKDLVTANISGMPSGATIYYSVNNGEWILGPVRATDAGEYAIRWYIDGGDNYEDSNVFNGTTVKIARAVAKYQFTQDVESDGTYGYAIRVNQNSTFEQVFIFDSFTGCRASTGTFYLEYDPRNYFYSTDDRGYHYTFIDLTVVDSNYEFFGGASSQRITITFKWK
jgi:hypothetical protein